MHLQATCENTVDLLSYLQQVAVMHILKGELREQNPEVQQARACLVSQDLPALSPEVHWLKMLNLGSFLLQSLQFLSSDCVHHFVFSAFQLQLCKPVYIFGERFTNINTWKTTVIISMTCLLIRHVAS